MARLRLFLGIAVALTLPALAVGCSESHTSGDDDAGITLMLDAGPPRPDGSTPIGPVCGNSRVEAMEQCDDGNVAPGDGCDASCAREPYCGDGVTTAPEVCDDENNRSADGCRSDCLSNELCGNGITDYAVGEVCDSEATCGTDCRSVTGCGDGTIGDGEQCDDGNVSRWDGCGADCRDEISMVVQMLAFGERDVGCDYSGDGAPDNEFSAALGAAAPLLNMALGGGGGGGPTFLMSFMGLDDPRGQDDDSLRLAWMQGGAGPTPGTYSVDPGSLNADGSPLTSLQGSIAARNLDAGPEDLDLPIGFLPLTLYQGRVQGVTSAAGGELDSLASGLLCGVIPPTLLTAINSDLIEMLGGGGGFMIEIGDPCDGSTSPATLADMLIGGFEVFGIRIGRRSPDVDLDGDGLETFEVERDGVDGCQPIVTACIDGDGTRIEGRSCMDDPRIADGYSAGLTFTATRAEIVGSGSGTMGGGGGAVPPPAP